MWNGSPLNSLIIGLPLLLMMPGISTLAVLSFKFDPLSFIRTCVDNDLAFAIALRDFARPLVQPRPLQPRERCIVEMTFNEVTDEGRLTISMGARQVELATTIHRAIAVIISFALE